jgi:hypothetical protein
MAVPNKRHFLLQLHSGAYSRDSPKYIFLHRIRRHTDKHTRPYICSHASCRRKSFGDKGGLDRHKREVHGSQVYKCPVPNCKRSKQGFPRSYNLFEHQKRVHGLQSSGLPQARSNTSEELSDDEGMSPTTHYLIEADGANAVEFEPIGETRGDTNSRAQEEFMTKLRELRSKRAKLDKDIRSMERTLRIMAGGSP